jgi:hypothetical protein
MRCCALSNEVALYNYPLLSLRDTLKLQTSIRIFDWCHNDCIYFNTLIGRCIVSSVGILEGRVSTDWKSRHHTNSTYKKQMTALIRAADVETSKLYREEAGSH